jgi:PIN domain nuclease of toxin-antitoxin system
VTEATTAVVADTHIVIWYLLNPAKLSQEATGALERCVASNETIRVSAYSLVELVYAVERANNPFTEEDRQAVLGAFAADDSPFELVPVTAEIANRVASVPRATKADPGDRIVVATAEVLGLPIVSADPKFPGMTGLAVIS